MGVLVCWHLLERRPLHNQAHASSCPRELRQNVDAAREKPQVDLIGETA
jgi:hypothetical protein